MGFEQSSRVVITGVGASTPLGHSFTEIGDALQAGRSGIDWYDAGTFNRLQKHAAASVQEILLPTETDSLIHTEQFEKSSRIEQFMIGPAAHALADAGINPKVDSLEQKKRVGIIAGIGAEQLKGWECDFLDNGHDVFEASRQPSLVHRVAHMLGVNGPATTVAAACASSGYALALGKTWLTHGLVDACVVGGCDVLSPTALAAFHNLRALSRRDDDPQKASRPFDRNRDGFVMGEGGVFFVLERQRAAEDRQCKIYGELAGIGMSSDASHMVTPCSDPVQASRAITEAIVDANLLPADVDYINAHAAGTPVGDAAEAGAIRNAFGTAATEIFVSSTKSMSGHLISAAAAFEALACLVAIERNMVPPTINLDDPDENCCLRHVPHQSISLPVHVAASNSFGFGGSNLCLVLKSAA